MAMKCELCGKGPQYGNVVSHANNTRRRRWNPNLKRVRAVVAGVHIQPAVKFSPSWKGNSLVITPLYHLAANTAYTVTIAKTAIRSASGASAAAPINIAFGTAPTPTPAPVAPPALVPVALGMNGTGGSLLYSPDGSLLLSTVGLVPGSSTASPSASASLSPTLTPGTSTPSPEGVI